MAQHLPAAFRLGVVALTTAAAALVGPFGSVQAARAGSGTDGPGGKGAQVYCFMRNNGNSHAVSWAASYALVKRQSAGVFKTSPEHAAVMITEAVVQNPSTFPDCGRFLGDLYAPQTGGTTASTPAPSQGTVIGSGSAGDSGMTRSERYN